MPSMKERYHDIRPVTLQLEGGTVSSSLFCEEAEAIMEGAGPLVECFLVEVFRCKLCQFTSGSSNAIRNHLLLRHRAPALALVDGAQEDSRAESSPYQLSLDEESKACDEDEDFLLYNMLDNMSPAPCDISVEAGHGCVVGSLFEEEQSMDFSAASEQEQMAQSAHLLTLGLCRISTARPAPPTSIRAKPLQLPDPNPLSQQKDDGGSEAPPSHRRQLPCFLCTDILTSRRMLDIHVRSHTADGGFCCVRCSWTTHSWEELLPHWRSHYRKRKRRKRRSLQVHMTEGDQPTADDQPESSKSHASVGASRERRRKMVDVVGADQTSLCCSLCHRRFSSQLTLRRHMGVHSGQKVFSCSHCGYSSRLKGSLQQHMRTHTGEKPHRCMLCSYASIDRSSLIRHQRMHTQEKPHRCEQCQYSSIQKKSLQLHIRRHHSGERFPCGQCGYCSPDPQLLMQHRRRHHHRASLTSAVTTNVFLDFK